MRRTKEDAERTRTAILDAALEIFHLRGVASAGLMEIAVKAGVTRGAVYWHFKDKQDLYFALYDALTEEFESRPEDYSRRRYADLDEFIADIQRPLKLLENNRRFQMFISIVYSRMEYVEAMKPIIENEQEKQRTLVAAYIDALNDLQQRGFVARHVDCRQFAYILYSFVDGAYDSRSFDTEFYPRESSPYLLLEDLFRPLRETQK